MATEQNMPQRRGRRAARTAMSGAEAAAPGDGAEATDLAAVFDAVPALIRGQDGRILHWTRALTDLYGFTAAEAVGADAVALRRSQFPMPFAEIQAELQESGIWRGEVIHHHRDGRAIAVSTRWVLHRDDAGAPVRVVELDIDMTGPRQSQALVAEREARLRSILDTAPDAIITIDANGIILSFSHAAERMFGYTAGETIGRNVSMLMPAPHAAAHDGYLDHYKRTGEKRIIGIGREVEARRKDGSLIPAELAVGELLVGGSRVFTGFLRDLSQRVRMEEELRQAQKMEAVGQLTGGVAHDFNNLLTVISGNLEMLERRVADRAQREMLVEAQEAVALGAQLARRLLAFGRRQPLEARPVQLNALVSGMEELLRRSLGGAVRVEVRLAPDLPMTLADPGQVENALLNLAINARDAMPDGGMLRIETRRTRIASTDAAAFADVEPGNYVTLVVTDNGSGMPPEVRQRAFEPFFTTKGPGSGTGLGLSTIYGFARQSGGHVQIDSEPGCGTTVLLHLPELATAAGAGPGADAEDVARVVRRATVLVVEDDPRVRRIAVRRLGELGYDVIEAANGPEAMTVLAGPRGIDVLFTDVVMAGGMSGFDVAREARALRPDLRILLTSGYADPALGGGHRPDGAGWLAKPHSLEELQASLNDLLGR
jgi:PAS domain S-box-containing protein